MSFLSVRDQTGSQKVEERKKLPASGSYNSAVVENCQEMQQGI